MVKFIIFADDTSILCPRYDIGQLTLRLCKILDELRVWFMVNKVSLNVKKTNFMMSERKLEKYIAIKIDNSIIESVCTQKCTQISWDGYGLWLKLEETDQKG